MQKQHRDVGRATTPQLQQPNPSANRQAIRPITDLKNAAAVPDTKCYQ